jgi:hypothetical protein
LKVFKPSYMFAMVGARSDQVSESLSWCESDFKMAPIFAKSYEFEGL